ncbi:hypothetical protein [Nocardia shimofusensis]|uniref:hypothetical protein n=1 Tax=Nocardia shimofusensis TaxID=228596 RepID=UPI000832C8E8|nr:hypothetical protein [Nocardia shimofusensis]
MADAAYVVLIFAGFLACALVLRAINGRAGGGPVAPRVLDRDSDAHGPDGQALDGAGTDR